jgi:flagellar basal body-associated protein FliL
MAEKEAAPKTQAQTPPPPAPPAGDAESAAPKAAPEPKGPGIKEKLGELKGKIADIRGIGTFVKTGVKAIVLSPVVILRGLIHGDLATKILTFGFAASVVLLVVSGSKLYRRYVVPHLPKTGVKTEAGDNINKFVNEQKELQLAASNLLYLDKFTATLTHSPGRASAYEVELFLECDEPKTSDWARAHLDQVREWVANTLQNQDYDKLLTEDGKNELRAKIIERVNHGFKHEHNTGVIRRVFFTRFAMG